MNWRIVSLLCLVLLLVLGCVWLLHGRQVYTKTATQVTVTDELFGTESVAWKPGLRIGLDMAVPAGAVLVAVAVFGTMRARRRRPETEGGE